MRRNDRQITDNTVIQDLLNTSPICRLGFIDGNHAYIVPVHYAHKDGYIYVHSAKEGKKIELVRRNPDVSFEIDDEAIIVPSEKPCGWTTRYRSVMGTGTIKIETGTQEKITGLDLLMEKYGAPKPYVYDERTLEKMVLLVLKINTISGKQSGSFQ